MTAYLDSLLNAGLPDSESDTEPWHKKNGTPPKKGGRNLRHKKIGSFRSD